MSNTIPAGSLNSAWSRDFTNLPKDRAFLYRHREDTNDVMCIRWFEYGDDSYWGYTQDLLTDADPSLHDEIENQNSEFEWCEIPA